MLKETSNQAFLILTKKSSASVIELYQKIQTAANRFGDTTVVYHNTSGIPEEIKNLNYYSFTNDILEQSNYTPIASTLIPGSNHFPLLEFYLKNPSFDYYWFIEDDVRFSGDWDYFFDFFTKLSDQPDFISSHIRTYQDEPAWGWWHTLTHPRNVIPFYTRIRSFNPIYRISNSALKFIHQMLINKWEGHHEVLLPTLLHLEGFEIRDFGGIGKFVIPGSENEFYLSNQDNIYGNLNSGTMRYRPTFTLDFEAENKLYHPVKL